MTHGLDTSVIIRLLIGEPADRALAAQRSMATAPRGSVAFQIS